MKHVATTTATNVVGLLAGAVVGIGAARLLGPTDRGLYTAVLAWFGASLVIAEVGQTAAVCFFAARNRDEAQDYLRASRRLLLVTGVTIATIGFFLAPYLTDNRAAVFGYRMAFAIGIPLSLLAGTATAVLQATNLRAWNQSRLLVPMTLLGLFGVLAWTRAVRLETLLVAFVLSMLFQMLAAEFLCRRELRHRPRFKRELVSPLVRYGAAQLASRLPTTINVYVDKLVLSVAVPPADLGRYAVAATFTGLAVPIATAIGSLAMPQIAAGGSSAIETQQLAARSLRLAFMSAAIILVPIAVLAPLYVPALLGPEYREAVSLIWVLAPGGLFLAATQVQGDILRGRGQPLAVARAQGIAAVVTVIGLSVAVPVFGVLGAAVTSTLSYALAFLLMRRTSALKPDDGLARER